MIIKLLGVADMLAILAMFLATILPQNIVIILAVYLIFKGFIFAIMGSIPSMIDMIAGIYIIAASFGISHWGITLIASIYLLQKAVISVFS